MSFSITGNNGVRTATRTNDNTGATVQTTKNLHDGSASVVKTGALGSQVSRTNNPDGSLEYSATNAWTGNQKDVFVASDRSSKTSTVTGAQGSFRTVTATSDGTVTAASSNVRTGVDKEGTRNADGSGSMTATGPNGGTVDRFRDAEGNTLTRRDTVSEESSTLVRADGSTIHGEAGTVTRTNSSGSVTSSMSSAHFTTAPNDGVLFYAKLIGQK